MHNKGTKLLLEKFLRIQLKGFDQEIESLIGDFAMRDDEPYRHC